MNFRNKKLVIILRTIFGLFMIFSGVSGLMAGFSGLEGIPEPMQAMTQTLWDTGIFQMIKVTETIAGIMLVAGFLPWLAAIFLAPIAVGIIIVNARISPAYLPMAIIVTLLTMYLGYAYWNKYRKLFDRRAA